MKKIIYLLLMLSSFSYAATTQTITQKKKTKKHTKVVHHHKHRKHRKHHYTAPASVVAAAPQTVINKSHSDQASEATDILDSMPKSNTKFTPIEKDINIAHQPRFYSYSTLSVNADTGEVYTSKNPNAKLPIASISKLMTAMVTLDANVDMDAYVTISQDDVDDLRHTFSRLRVGAKYKRKDLLLLALMSSENRAAHALARTSYSGGLKEFITKMNGKAIDLGMNNTKFYDPTGLNQRNQSTAMDLSKMVHAAFGYKLIRQDTTTKGSDFNLTNRNIHHYINSDALVRAGKFNIAVSKTGFINEAGHCLVLYAMVDKTPVIMVFLNSSGKNGRILDAITTRNYIRKNF